MSSSAQEQAGEWSDWKYVRPYYERDGFYRRQRWLYEECRHEVETLTLTEAAAALNEARTALEGERRKREEAEGKAALANEARRHRLYPFTVDDDEFWGSWSDRFDDIEMRAGIRRGVADLKAGRVVPWPDGDPRLIAMNNAIDALDYAALTNHESEGRSDG